MTQTFKHTDSRGDWELVLNDNLITVTRCNEQREYELPDLPVKATQDAEYVILTMGNGLEWHFKFEANDFFVGDIYTAEGEHVSEYANYVFGEYVDFDDDTEAPDLFEHINTLPKNIQEVLFKYAQMDETYENCENLLNELEPLGYTFEYGLDAKPFGLKLIN